MLIRRFKKSDLNQINNITQLLHPKWFDNNAIRNIPIDSQINNCFVAEQDNKIVGFITFSAKDGEVRINWLGVLLNYHRQGTGSKLLQAMINFIKKLGVKMVIVETVVEQNPQDGSYDETLKFYYKQDFKIRKKYHQEQFNEFTYSKGLLEKGI